MSATSHNNRSKGWIAPPANCEFHARGCLFLHKHRPRAEPMTKVIECRNDSITVVEVQPHSTCVAFVHEPWSLRFENDRKP
jgi:hypothetical protein